MDFQIEDNRIRKVRVYGQDYNVNKPTVAQAKKMRELVKDVDDSQATDVMMTILDKLGFPKAASESMALDDFLKLSEFVFASKKK